MKPFAMDADRLRVLRENVIDSHCRDADREEVKALYASHEALANALEALVVILDSKFVNVEVATKREADQITEANKAATAALRAVGRLAP